MEEKKFHQQFTIHPVGQGLFYSCIIKRQEKVVFRMVFDCGSKTAGAGQEEVRLYRDIDFEYEKVLDLLVISHFDSDHVNQIGRLLEGGIKVKRLLMPFLSFEERLYLTFKMLEENNGYNSDLDYATRLILDPLTTLAENLDSDSETYIIESDPENPILPENINDFEIENKDERRLVFIFPSNAKKRESGEIKGKVFKVKDSAKGSAVGPQRGQLLMEFLFYKKSIGLIEEKFYKKIKELFFKQQQIGNNLQGNDLHEVIVEKIKKISSSRIIVKIFESAANEIGIQSTNISNLNTTALCMLHRNLQNICDYITEEKFSFDKYRRVCKRGFYHIQKILADKPYRIVKECDFHFFMDYEDFHYGRNRNIDIEDSNFPNVLLTSDCYLKERVDVKAFMEKYRHYLSNFWLFQIPHHGSRENSNAVLHSNLSSFSKLFINYGTGNTHKHPSFEVIESLVVNGVSSKLFSVNEFQGLIFSLSIEID